MNPKALHKISYGLYVVSSKKGDSINGQIANTVFQVCADPPVIAVCINKKNLTHEFIQGSKVFTVSILSKETPMKFIGLFGFKSGRDVNKFEKINYKIGVTGSPIVTDNAIGYVEADIINSIDVETHTIFIGKILDAQIMNDSEPLTYTYYHEIKKGKVPKTAPTYIEENKKEVKKMDKYRCKACGYIYDPEKGDPDGGIDPGTPFEDIPDDWVCPVCGVGKDMFEKESQREDGIDFVVIVTPNNTHFPISKASLEHGIHVVCDKPLTISSRESEQLAEISDEKDLLFCVTYTYTGYPMVKQMKAMIANGELGEIRFINAEYPQEWLAASIEKTGQKQSVWRTDPSQSGASNCVGDIGSHIENMVSYLTGLKITSLCARLDTFVEGRILDDNASILVEYDRGAKGLYWSSQVAIGHDNGLSGVILCRLGPISLSMTDTL